MSLSLKLLGEFGLFDGSGASLSLPTRKTRALLGYLAVNAGRPQPRERLMALLWSNRGERQARQSLNQALLAIRRLANREDITLLDSDGERVTLRGEALESDVGRFQSLLDDDPAEAAALYAGAFLDGLSVPDPAFEDWLLSARSELQTLACDALERAADTVAEAGDLKGAIGHATRLVSLDPLREEAHRRLMRLLQRSGDRAAALRQYRACAEVLKRELQVEPDAATRALFEEVRRDAGAIDEAASQPLPSDTPPPLPDKPSIAVLPFVNLSGDPEQEIFADGMAEDIIAGLSRYRWFFVIARNSSFTYKGRAVDVKQVAQDLGVRYVLEGSVRKAGERMRVTTQLIDATAGTHIWAERYDRELDDIFALQDEITETIVAAIEPELGAVERERAWRKPPNNLDAWESYQRGLWHTYGDPTHDGRAEVKRLFQRACDLDPGFAAAFADLAWAHTVDITMGFTDSPEVSLEEAARAAEKAVALDARNPAAHVSLGRVHLLRHAPERAIAEMEAAIDLNSSFDNAYYGLGQALLNSGRLEESIPQFEKAIRLSPRSPRLWAYRYSFARAYFVLERYEQAMELYEKVIQRPNIPFMPFAHAAATLGHLGRVDEAREMLVELKKRKPDFSADTVRNSTGQLGQFSGADRIIDGLRKAGLPE